MPRLTPGLAEILDIPQMSTAAISAAALARISKLPEPKLPESLQVLAAIVVALQLNVLEYPAMPVDRAEVTDSALSEGCLDAGEAAVRATLDELGSDALDWYVRAALHSTIAPALAERGMINLIGS